LTTLVSGRHYITDLAIDAAAVYFTEQGLSSYGGQVISVPLAGGAPTTLASGQAGPNGIAVDATSIYWVNGDEDIAVFPVTGSVVKMPLGGGTPITLASGQANPVAIAVDATSIYYLTEWVNYGTSGVMKLTPK
jgi:hypothetical protein